MAAHRYWRAVAMEAHGAGDLELSCFHLLDAAGVRVDATAALTASVAPATGAVASLQDDDLTTAARWSAQSVAALTLNWDFGISPVDVSDIRLAGNSEARFPLITKLQYSDNATAWAAHHVFSGVSYPGSSAKTQSSLGLPTGLGLTSYLDFEGANNSTVMTDLCGKSYVAVGAAKLTTTAPLIGGSSLSLGGAGGYLTTSSGLSDFAFGTGDFVLETFIRVSASARDMVLADFYISSGAASWQILVRASGGLSFYRGGATGAGYVLTGAANLRDGVGHHVEVSRTSGVLRFFVDGVPDGSLADSADYSNTTPSVFAIGAQVSSRNGTYDFLGSIDEFAYAKGVSGHTSAFTPRSTTQAVQLAVTNRVKGRAATTDTIAVGTGPAIIYGIPQVTEPFTLTVQSGSVKDLATGVLGTGRGRVSGTVKETPASPVYRKVRLIREIDGLQMRELWSHPVTGAYSFDFIDELQKFTVLSYDHTGAFRAVVASGVTPELIP